MMISMTVTLAQTEALNAVTRAAITTPIQWRALMASEAEGRDSARNSQ
jgi:hypothetical protein